MTYLVRLIHGCKPQIYSMRFTVTKTRAWRFANGVAVISNSRSDALALAERMSKRRRVAEGLDAR